MEKAQSATYKPRKSAQNVTKQIIFPGNTLIKGTEGMRQMIELLCPDDGNARRESLMLIEVWQEKFGGIPVQKSLLIAMAAMLLQQSDKAFTNQPRKAGDGFARAKCTFSKTCHWMIREGLFVVVAPGGA